MTKTSQQTPKKDPRANLRRGGFEKKQPSPQSKSEGRERKRQAQKIMDQIMLYSDMSIGELKSMIKNQGDDMKVKDRRIAKYLTDDKFITDWLDRHIAKAPIQVENINTNIELQTTTEEQDEIKRIIKENL